MSYLLSVDPGLRACGCALWHLHAGLHAAAHVVTTADDGETSLGELVESMVYAVRGWLTFSLRHAPPGSVDLRAVVEVPQTYGGRAKRGDANDLIAIAAVAGAILAGVKAPTGLVRPHEWKGSVPKRNSEGVNVVKERALEALSGEEIARVALPSAKGLHHNVWDAVGIGLWWLRREGARP